MLLIESLSIVTIVMMCIAVGIEDTDNIELFLSGTCSPGTIDKSLKIIFIA